jgi:hypothetical protein
MTATLRKLRIRRVAYVDRGANPYAEQVIFKHADGKDGRMAENDLKIKVDLENVDPDR